MIQQILKAFEQLNEIEAIALGGSRAGGCFDEKSDYDIYLYCTGVIPAQVREGILSEFCSHLELGNSFWELEDSGILKNGIDFDILYRDLDSFSAGIGEVVGAYCPPFGGKFTFFFHQRKKVIGKGNGPCRCSGTDDQGGRHIELA